MLLPCVFCGPLQKTSINFQGLHRKSCSQAESGAEAVDEADQKGQNPLYLRVQAKHGHSRTDGEKSVIWKYQRSVGTVVLGYSVQTAVKPRCLLGLFFQEPQYGCKDKSLTFSSGSISMDVFTDRMGYKQGTNVFW